MKEFRRFLEEHSDKSKSNSWRENIDIIIDTIQDGEVVLDIDDKLTRQFNHWETERNDRNWIKFLLNKCDLKFCGFCYKAKSKEEFTDDRIYPQCDECKSNEEWIEKVQLEAKEKGMNIIIV